MYGFSDYAVDEVIDFVYNGNTRRGEVLAVKHWGVLVNVYGEGFKSFHYNKMKSVRTIRVPERLK